MVDTPTTNKALIKIPNGGDVGNWDVPVNGNWDKVDAALGGALAVTLTNADVTLSAPTSSAAGQSSNLVYLLSGALTVNVNLIFPAVGGLYIVQNGCTGSFAVTVKTSAGGSAVIVPQAARSLLVSDGTNMAFADDQVRVQVPPMRSYLAGLTLSRNASNPNLAIDFAAGMATSDDQSTSMILAATLTKSIGSAWSAGSGNGGLDTGSIAASTWYHAFAIQRPDTGAIDALFSTSATSPTMPSGYTLKRRVGSVFVDASSHFLAFTQNGDEFLWVTPTQSINATLGTTYTAFQISVPPNIKVNAMLRGYVTSAAAGASAVVVSPDETGTVNSPAGNTVAITPNANGFAAFSVNVRTDVSSRVKAASTQAATMTAVTYGWIDRRGRDA